MRNVKSVGDAVGGGDILAGQLMLGSTWSEMREGDHFVQFYEADEFLTDSLSGWVSAGHEAGEACGVVAARERREGLEQRLRAGGLDVDALEASGRYVAFDAAELLSRLMVDGMPEPGRCVGIIGDIIARAASGNRRVRVFGEMVALLCAEGNYEGAVRLEGLWNEVRATHAFQLFCAYPLSGFGGGEAHAEPLSRVCAGHSRVIPAESYTSLADAEEQLRAVTLLQQQARSLQREIAERKEAEEALRAALEERERLLVSEQIARAEAESANRLKDEFLATVSHELRTPLTAIVGWAHMLRHGSLDETTAARGLETIERNAQSQAQLVEDILDVSRVITGKLRLNIGQVDAASVVNDAIDSVQLAADTKGIKLEVRLDPSARHVAGDAGRLQQVVWNLLSNAIKFTPAGGRVEVRMERAGSDAQIRVSDTGCGIAPDFLPFIFDRFRQADGSTMRAHGGLGLGLSIVRHLVELHGGTVHASSEGEGRGSTFTIRLPLAAQERARGRRADAAAASVIPCEDAGARAPSLEGVRVLLVDDDEDTLRMLAHLLTEYRAAVQTATDAAQALEALRWFKPDVLVSDLAMGGEDGHSLINKVRRLSDEDGRHTPAVALTAYVRVEDRARALSAGFNVFIPKPVEPCELVTAIANLAEHCAPDF